MKEKREKAREQKAKEIGAEKKKKEEERKKKGCLLCTNDNDYLIYSPLFLRKYAVEK